METKKTSPDGYVIQRTLSVTAEPMPSNRLAGFRMEAATGTVGDDQGQFTVDHSIGMGGMALYVTVRDSEGEEIASEVLNLVPLVEAWVQGIVQDDKAGIVRPWPRQPSADDLKAMLA